MRISGWKNFGSGIRDKHPGSQTLLFKQRDVQIYVLKLLSRGETTYAWHYY